MPRFLRMTLVTGLTCSMPVLALYAQQPPPSAPASQPAAKTATKSEATSTSNDPIERIKEEGLKRSQVMATLSYLTDVIGPRLTGSPNMKRANEWTRDKLAAWGLANAHLEAWGPFGRGWELKRFSAQIIEPQCIPLIGFPKAWSPGTDGTLVAPSSQAAVGFPTIPGVNYNGAANVRELFDYGPEFERGIISLVPPVPTGRAYATLVPKTDQDGIDIAGIKLPDIAVPIGTYTGWNPLARAPKDECSAMGSFIPFVLTKAERIASNDPRLSLEERYGTHSRYVELVRQASERLVAERLLLQEDAEAFIKLAKERDLGLPR